jgi:hypothetical protein
MPSLDGRITAQAETAFAQITSRVVDHRQLTKLDSSLARVRGQRLLQPVKTRHSNALVDIVSVAESFTSGRLLQLQPAVSQDEVSTWAKRKKAWSKYRSVDLTTSGVWSSLMGFVEVRNAFQHGLGRLTDRQLGTYRNEVLAWIKASSVHLNGDLLRVTADDVENCAGVCVDFVAWLDGTAPFV